MRAAGWAGELERWLAPFVEGVGRSDRRRCAPVYVRRLLAPGERESVEPLAASVAPYEPGAAQALHHFATTAPWDAAPREAALAREAPRPVGGPHASRGFDRVEGRGWTGLRRHAFPTMPALAFLQRLRLADRTASRARGDNPADGPRGAPRSRRPRRLAAVLSSVPCAAERAGAERVADLAPRPRSARRARRRVPAR